MKNNVAEASIPSSKEAVEYSASELDMTIEGEKQKDTSATLEEFLVNKNEVSGVNHSRSSLPPILIRSAAECEEKKSAGLTEKSKTKSKPLGASEADRKSKTSLRKMREKKSNSKSISQDAEEITQMLESQRNRSNLDDAKAETKYTVTAKSLKLGSKVTAKIYQVRAHGLVLDLGGGLRGMHRFEVCLLSY